MTTEQRCNITQQRRERASQGDRQISFASDTQQPGELVDNQYRSDEVPLFDHPSIVHKVTEFHNSLMSLAAIKCTVCLENFRTLKTCSDHKYWSLQYLCSDIAIESYVLRLPYDAVSICLVLR